MRVSFLISIISGFILLIASILFIMNYKTITSIYSIITILILLSIGYGIHGLQHANEEIYYDFNPLVGKWKVNDDVQKQNL